MSDEMFLGWDNFFYLIGSAAGALIGLMFVVITLTAGHDPRRVSQGAPVYVAPTVFHFAVVLVVSATTQVPRIPSTTAGVLIALCAIWGLVYSTVTAIRLCRRGWEDPLPDWSDKGFYGFLPSTIYLALAIAAATLPFADGKVVHALGAMVLALLMLGIRNAWDLATTLAQRAYEQRNEQRSKSESS